MKTRLIAISLLVLSLVAVPNAASAATSTSPTRIPVASGQVSASPDAFFCAFFRICVS